MSQENVEIVRPIQCGVQCRDLDAALAATIADSSARPAARARQSGIGTRRRSDPAPSPRTAVAAFDAFISDVEQYIDAGDMVVALPRWRAEGKSSGAASTSARPTSSRSNTTGSFG